MTAPFKVGDWVMADGAPRVARRIDTIDADTGAVYLTDSCGPKKVTDLHRVRVSIPKPPRKLTLSAGLAWIRYMTNDRFAITFDQREGRWQVWNGHAGKEVGHGATPLKAIIAARKAIGVK